jgi:hypothetical protein
MKSLNNATKLTFIFAVISAVLAVFIGEVFYPVDDGGPAKYIGLLALVMLILSIVFYRREYKQGKSGSRWMYRIALTIVFALLILIVWGIVCFINCASNSSCQLFAP